MAKSLDEERCTTDVFKTRGLVPGQYVEITDIRDECSKLEMKEAKAEVILFAKNYSLQNISGLDGEC